MTDRSSSYDVALAGGGVTGTAQLWVLALFTNVRRIILIERREAVALVNSNVMMNAQTLHTGPHETNYDKAKALKVKAGAKLLEAYLRRHASDASKQVQKMVIGVGAEEVALLEARYESFKQDFPELRLLNRDEIAAIEPNVIKGRDPNVPIVGLYVEVCYAVNYQRVAESLLAHAAKSGKEIDVVFKREIKSITKSDSGFVIKTNRGDIKAKAVSVCTGGSSLNFAHAMGLGTQYSLLAVSGSFYTALNFLRGKVYTVQNPDTPFAEIHGDPAVHDPSVTRFGPTAKPLPMIERHRWNTVIEWIRSGALGFAALWSLVRILSNSNIARFALKNFLYEIPFLGKWMFLRSARKVVPSLRYGDLTFASGEGGIRSQLVDNTKHALAKRVDKIVGDGIIFTMAPSPGASYCLGNAVEDVETLMRFLGEGYRFDKAGMHAHLFGADDDMVEEGAVL